MRKIPESISAPEAHAAITTLLDDKINECRGDIRDLLRDTADTLDTMGPNPVAIRRALRTVDGKLDTLTTLIDERIDWDRGAPR